VLLAAFRGVQARGTKLTEERAKALLQTGFTALNAEDAQTELWGIRLLNALPTVAAAGALKLDAAAVQALESLVTRAKAPNEIRVGAAEALLTYSPSVGLKAVQKQLAEPTTPEGVRVGLLLAAAASKQREAQAVARESLQTVPYRVAVPIGLALAGTPGGANQMLDAIKAGKAPARLLQEKAILERLKGANAPDWQKRVADLTKNLPPADQRITAIIKTRGTGFAKAKADKAEGAKLFTKHCAACHKIGDVGGKIAPQLDGVGVRGPERLLEDILDPNRNVDAAFRARSITLTSDKTLTALPLRTEGEVLVVADLEGKEQRIPLKEIATNRETMLSAMPANFADVIPEQDLYHIVAYLLEQRQKEVPKKE
jgi:putative heme-binding domain-containing protein